MENNRVACQAPAEQVHWERNGGVLREVFFFCFFFSVWVTWARAAGLATDTADGGQLFPTKLHPCGLKFFLMLSTSAKNNKRTNANVITLKKTKRFYVAIFITI